MTAFPAANYVSDAARTEAEQKAAFEAWLAATKQLPGGIDTTTLTIASGAITPNRAMHQIDTEAAAATDDLATINQSNMPDGSLLFISTASSSRDVVVKHAAGGGGQIRLAGSADLTLLDNTMWLCLRRNGTLWDEVFRYYGEQSGAHRTFFATPGFGQNTYTGRQEWDKGADIASGATLTLGTDGNYFSVTGTTTITAISSAPIGTRVLLHFQGALTITHNAVSLILPAGANLFTSAGTTLEFVSEGSGNWRMISATLAESTQILDRVSANTTVQNTAAETTIYTFSVPGGTIGSNKRLRLELQLSLADDVIGNGGLTLRLKYGATTLAAFPITTSIDDGTSNARIGAAAWGVIATALVSADGATDAQVGHLASAGPLTTVAVGAGNAVPAGVIGAAASGGRGTATEDSTAAKNLVVTAQWSGAAPQKVLVMEHAILVRE